MVHRIVQELSLKGDPIICQEALLGGLNVDPSVKTVATLLAIRAAQFQHRKHNAKKEIADAHINDKKERITEQNLNHMVQRYSRKERQEIIRQMKDDKTLAYNVACYEAEKMRTKRALRNTALWMASMVAVPWLLINRQSINNKVHDSLGKNKIFQEFARSMKHRSMKDTVVLRPDEYEIDKQWKLSSGRG